MGDWKGIEAERLLEALAGTVYLTDTNLKILAVGTTHWRRFAEANEAPELAEPGAVVGRNLFEFIQGNQTRELYAEAIRVLRTGRPDTIVVPYSCDAPGRTRAMRLYMTLMPGGGENRLILFQNILLEERERPEVPLLRGQAARTQAGDAPLLAICSYCKRVRYPAGQAEGEWLLPEAYYQRGGDDRVRLTHGICPACFETVMRGLAH